MSTPTSNSICYNTAIPGIMDPAETDPSFKKNSDNRAYADPNGDLNIFIEGPYNSSTTDIDAITYKVFISKEDARNKNTVFEQDSAVVNADSTAEEISTAIIYSETDINNADLENFYLRIKHTQLMLARGTYVLRIFKKISTTANESDDSTEGFDEVRVISLTVRSNPIQGKVINDKYLETANSSNILIGSSATQCGCQASKCISDVLVAAGYCAVCSELNEINGEDVIDPNKE